MMFARPAASYISVATWTREAGPSIRRSSPPSSGPPHFTHLPVFDCHSLIAMPKLSNVPPGLSHVEKQSSEHCVDKEAVTAAVRVLLTIGTRAFSFRNALEFRRREGAVVGTSQVWC
jgi:hypothetical protein